jgi:hypothetical protein
MNVEKNIFEPTAKDARKVYEYDGRTPLPALLRGKLQKFEVETVEDIMMLLALSMKHNLNNTLIEIHDKLMVSDIEIAYDTLIVMIMLGDKRDMYMEFVPATSNSTIQSKGIYRRCLGALPIYASFAKAYYNPALDKDESYPKFAEDIIKGTKSDFAAAEKYREYISVKYADLIKNILEVRND